MCCQRDCAQRRFSDLFAIAFLTSSFLLTACDNSRPTDGAGNSANHQVVGSGNESVTVMSPLYLIKIQFGRPFGIVLLKTITQPRNFAHSELPLADWEWFWFDDDGGGNPNKQIKLIQSIWDPPTVEEGSASVQLLFTRDEILNDLHFSLEVEYILCPDRRFEVVYRVRNNSRQPVAKPYAMVGFPGFSDPAWINEVGGSVETRMPLSPFQNFKQEILSQNRAESTLLWAEWTAGSPDTLRAELTVKAIGGTYELQATYVPDDDVDQVSAGHVVKPAYLTSHLYVTFKDIPPEMSRSLRIHYRLRDSTSSFSSR